MSKLAPIWPQVCDFPSPGRRQKSLSYSAVQSILSSWSWVYLITQGNLDLDNSSLIKQHLAIISKCGLGILEMESVQSVNLGAYCLIYTVQRIVQPEKAPPPWTGAGLSAAFSSWEQLSGSDNSFDTLLFPLGLHVQVESEHAPLKEAVHSSHATTATLFFTAKPWDSSFFSKKVFQKGRLWARSVARGNGRARMIVLKGQAQHLRPRAGAPMFWESWPAGWEAKQPGLQHGIQEDHPKYAPQSATGFVCQLPPEPW